MMLMMQFDVLTDALCCWDGFLEVLGCSWRLFGSSHSGSNESKQLARVPAKPLTSITSITVFTCGSTTVVSQPLLTNQCIFQQNIPAKRKIKVSVRPPNLLAVQPVLAKGPRRNAASVKLLVIIIVSMLIIVLI